MLEGRRLYVVVVKPSAHRAHWRNQISVKTPDIDSMDHPCTRISAE
jgi:hypothetical protein